MNFFDRQIKEASLHPLWPRALEYASEISYESSPELNAVKILELLKKFDQWDRSKEKSPDDNGRGK